MTTRPLFPFLLSRRLAHGLSHVTADGSAPRMVDVGAKARTKRVARARAVVELPEVVAAELRQQQEEQQRDSPTADGGGGGGAVAAVRDIRGPKGSVFATSIIAGVMGAKRTSDLMPFCHQLNLDKCDVRLELREGGSAIEVTSEVAVEGKTGVEMEALTSVSVASLCIYDMLKALSHDIKITDIGLVSKTGGKSDLLPAKEAPDGAGAADGDR